MNLAEKVHFISHLCLRDKSILLFRFVHQNDYVNFVVKKEYRYNVMWMRNSYHYLNLVYGSFWLEQHSQMTHMNKRGMVIWLFNLFGREGKKKIQQIDYVFVWKVLLFCHA